MKRFKLSLVTIFMLFLVVFNPSSAQNQQKIQNCITAHEFMDSRISYEREQALAAVYANAGYNIIGSWLSMGASTLSTWGGFWGFALNTFSLQDHNVAIDLIERLYWERILQASYDLNNCINFS